MPKSLPPRKKRRQTPKSRAHETFVQFDVAANHGGSVSVEFGPRGSITSKQATRGTFKSVTTYVRASGKEKVVFSQQGETEFAFLAQSQQLLSSFDCIAALDAGTVQVGDVKVSTACLALSSSSLAYGELTFDLYKFAFFDVPDQVNPEMVALDLALHHILNTKIADQQRIGIVMDTELGAHNQINTRAISYLGSSFLPEGVRLIYASADTGQGPAHDLIKICDKEEKSFRDEVLGHPEWINPKIDQYPYCCGWILSRPPSVRNEDG